MTPALALAWTLLSPGARPAVPPVDCPAVDSPVDFADFAVSDYGGHVLWTDATWDFSLALEDVVEVELADLVPANVACGTRYACQAATSSGADGRTVRYVEIEARGSDRRFIWLEVQDPAGADGGTALTLLRLEQDCVNTGIEYWGDVSLWAAWRGRPLADWPADESARVHVRYSGSDGHSHDGGFTQRSHWTSDGCAASEVYADGDPHVFTLGPTTLTVLEKDAACNGRRYHRVALDGVEHYVDDWLQPADRDGDGFIAADCLGDDCADYDPATHPGAWDRGGDGIDRDCDGRPDDDMDLDGSRWPDDCDDLDPMTHPGADWSTIPGSADDVACKGRERDEDEDGWSATLDCDDADPAANPAEDLLARRGLDLDCDGWLLDDCDDADAAAHPGAEEVWYDGVDQACDGGDDFDADGDGAPWPGDCDDQDPAVIHGCDPPAGCAAGCASPRRAPNDLAASGVLALSALLAVLRRAQRSPP